MAWLSATPEGDKTSRGENYRSNAERENGIVSHHLTMPELNEEEYILGLWQEAGSVSSGGMGIAALSWQEIQAWINVTETELEMWEKLLIRRLSQEYCSEYSSASDVSRPAPFNHIVLEEINREALSNNLKEKLRGLAKSH